MTLLELSVAAAMASIVLASAVSIFVVLINRRRAMQQSISAYDAIGAAVDVAAFASGNAGWRLPSSAFGVRVLDDVHNGSGLKSDGMGGGVDISASGNCGASGTLVDGSDVLELAEGYPDEPPGVVGSVVGQSSFRLLGNSAPLTAIPYLTALVVFADEDGNSCMASTSDVGTGDIGITMLKPDYSPDDRPAARYLMTSGSTCPQPGMRVYRVASRTRFFLCKDNGAQHPTLYVQRALGNGIFDPVHQVVQTNVVDFQVGVKIAETSSTNITGACRALGSGQSCDCNVTSACAGNDGNAAFSLDGSSSTAVVNSRSAVNWVRGVILAVTTASARPAVAGADATSSVYRRPSLLNRPGATGNGDGYSYVSSQVSVAFNNFTLVTP